MTQTHVPNLLNDPTATCISAGDTEATFLPGYGMVGISLRKSGIEVLRRIDNLIVASAANRTAESPFVSLREPSRRFPPRSGRARRDAAAAFSVPALRSEWPSHARADVAAPSMGDRHIRHIAVRAPGLVASARPRGVSLSMQTVHDRKHRFRQSDDRDRPRRDRRYRSARQLRLPSLFRSRRQPHGLAHCASRNAAPQTGCAPNSDRRERAVLRSRWTARHARFRRRLRADLPHRHALDRIRRPKDFRRPARRLLVISPGFTSRTARMRTPSSDDALGECCWRDGLAPASAGSFSARSWPASRTDVQAAELAVVPARLSNGCMVVDRRASLLVLSLRASRPRYLPGG